MLVLVLRWKYTWIWGYLNSSKSETFFAQIFSVLLACQKHFLPGKRSNSNSLTFNKYDSNAKNDGKLDEDAILRIIKWFKDFPNEIMCQVSDG